jgi:hypothetical protein
MGTVEPQVGTASDVQPRLDTATDAQSQVTDGFHLVIDALKLNGIDTIFGLPGIPITDFTRMAQAEGLRVIATIAVLAGLSAPMWSNQSRAQDPFPPRRRQAVSCRRKDIAKENSWSALAYRSDAGLSARHHARRQAVTR